MTAPDIAGEGTVRALRAALPGNAADRIGWIKAHGTATLQNDAAECRALRGLREDLPLSSLKPLFGHCLGASGAVELVAGVLALDAGLIPATLGTSDVDPLVGRRRVVLEPERLRHPGGVMLSQSLGGRCVALAVARAA